MAFRFNWSPLMADTSRAREMLTNALNKTPKPPIIVDDIIVTELNLGSVPPDLEILEVGDLAEDRFRGIFKMTYAGDAFLTLKTRVQANPLNTYLSQRPAFASPQPLAAASGLTIPLQITLSDIRLSGFIIIVFSRQKGLTIVFRNDPLESLKVSSTFDSIPFVRDYLQKEIEGQLRLLFMDDLPAILHRLSLRYCTLESLERKELEERVGARDVDTTWINPLAVPSSNGTRGDGEDRLSSISSSEASSENHLTFSRKNMSRLAALSRTHHTLSLHTPAVKDAVFRAWTGPNDLSERLGIPSPFTLSKFANRGSFSSGPSSSASSVISGQEGVSRGSRPSLGSFTSFSGSTTSNGRTRHRQKKNRIVDLRRRNSHTGTATTTTSELRPSTPEQPSDIFTLRPGEREGDVTTPPQTPPRKRRDQNKVSPNDNGTEAPETAVKDMSYPNTSTSALSSTAPLEPSSKPIMNATRPSFLPHRSLSFLHNRSLDKSSAPPMLNLRNISTSSEEAAASTSGILEQTMLLKMAAEIARKVNEQKQLGGDESAWLARTENVDDAPPAYVA